MSDATITALAGAGTALLTAIGAFLRWAVKLWADVRREAIKAQQLALEQQLKAQQTALEQQRADNARMVEALLEQARSNAQLAGRLDRLAGKLDALLAQGARPDEDEPRPRRANTRTQLADD